MFFFFFFFKFKNFKRKKIKTNMLRYWDVTCRSVEKKGPFTVLE